jgi:hypothetical protein
MFKGEALGLTALYHPGAMRIPKVYHYGDDGRGGSYIIMEHLALGGPKDQKEFGRAMARMHLSAPLAKEVFLFYVFASTGLLNLQEGSTRFSRSSDLASVGRHKRASLGLIVTTL